MHLGDDLADGLRRALAKDRLRTCAGLIERVGAHNLDPDVQARQRSSALERFRSERPGLFRVIREARANGRLVATIGDAMAKKRIPVEDIVTAVEGLVAIDHIDQQKVQAVVDSVLARTD